MTDDPVALDCADLARVESAALDLLPSGIGIFGNDFNLVYASRSYKVEIRIRDNGIGIPTEIKEKIFNPFFTTKPTGEGTGLGLSMSHDIIVKQHGGRIDVDTEPGKFTEFKIVLPRTGQK